MYRWCQYLLYCTNINSTIDRSSVCQIIWNELNSVVVIRINVNQVGLFVIPNYRIFAPNFLNFKIIFVLSIFEKVFATKVLPSTFSCAIPRQSSVGNIWNPSIGVEGVAVAWTVSICDYCSDGSLWVQPSAVINIPPVYSASEIITTIQTPKGVVVLITVDPYGCLVVVEDGWLNIWVVPIWSMSPEGVRDSYQEFTDPPISVGNDTWVGWSIIRFLGRLLLSGVEISFGIFLVKLWNVECIQFNFLIFPFVSSQFFHLIARILLNCFTRILFNCFICVLVFTPIYILFVVRISFMIFLTPILVILWNYTGTIEINFSMSSNCVVLFFGYTARPSYYLWQLSICLHMSWFMACISSVSVLYISMIYFILLMVISCDEHVCSCVEWNKLLNPPFRVPEIL